ncbi:hypothetical protein [Caldalkalibacillus salinus]|uniref:hypothetical protein n=1 Tax=Caldalkalibacillus salinus TaxID=2803787 RepID=UPI0019218DDA|nr:hypothetical protein [Caldalkalibacillus salinus]
MSKRLNIGVFILVLSVLFVVACSIISTDALESIEVYEMESFSDVKADSSVVITDPDDMKTLQKAVNRASKQPGVVDMVEPQYKVVLGEDTYFLWLSETLGTVMNTEDTHTIYSLSSKSAKQVQEIIADAFIQDKNNHGE